MRSYHLVQWVMQFMGTSVSVRVPGTWYLRGKKSHTASAAAVGHVPGTSTRYQASYAAP